ncbi:ABC transporter permease, partial [Candidatus Bathyarchaeota archaeon]|nr:ABC transporter permease [Candidatus Bathyarchaeota archaeon]
MRHNNMKIMQCMLLLCFFSSLTLNQYPAAQTTRSISGVVKDANGNPLVGASVAALVGTTSGTTTRTGAGGRYSLSIASNVNSIVVHADESYTIGVDYLPVRVLMSGVYPAEVNVTLRVASQVKFTGAIQFVDTESLSNDVTYNVVDEKGDVINISGFPLIFSKTKPALTISGWDPSTVILPIGYSRIKVVFSMKTSNPVAYIQKELIIEVPATKQGDLFEYDISKYTIPWNTEYVKDYLVDTKSKLTVLKENLFYLTKETVMISESEIKLKTSENLYDNGNFTASYTTLKDAFITIRQVKQTLESLNQEAYRSVYIILAFLAVSSIATGFILFETRSLSLVSGIIFYVSSAVILYNVYPSTMLVPISNYMIGVAAAIVVAVILSVIIPKIGSLNRVRGEISFLSTLTPIFTLSKRLMKRRRMRTLLTLFSISILTMSFVTLTSLSEEYGVSLSSVINKKFDGKGIMITASPLMGDTDSLYLSNAELDWLRELPMIQSIATKYINIPQRRAITTLRIGEEAKPIYGVIGIDATFEDQVSKLGKAVIEGVLPGQGEAAITRIVKEALNLKIGDSITLSGNKLTISGILDDGSLGMMTELDGSGYLPEKEVNISSPEEPPHYIRVPCEPEEALIVDYKTAMKINGCYQIRLNLNIQTGDVYKLGERIALERGYRVTAASEKGSITYVLGVYLAGKGLPLIIPWTIAVLSVVVTMMNALHERRKEI